MEVNNVERLGGQALTWEVLKLQCLIFCNYTVHHTIIVTLPVSSSSLPLCSPIVTRNFSGLAQGVDRLIRSFGACNSSEYPVH